MSTIIMDRIKNKLYEEKLLEIYSQKESIMEVLRCAVAQEIHFNRGAYLNSGTVLVKADSDPVTGLWEVTLEVDHGKVVYTCMDQEGNQINIFSIPNEKYIKNKEELSEAEIKTIQIQASNSIDINLKDMRTLKNAKDLFKHDYVLKHIPLYHLDADNAARFLIWHIRAYRKLFLEYYRKYKFLWEGTRFKNCKSLANAMIDRGLVDAEFFQYDYDPETQKNEVLKED